MSDKFDGLYSIRSATPEDRNFVLKSFLLGLYYGDSWFSRIPKNIFMDNYKRAAVMLFDNPGNLVVIACLSEDPQVILGYSILSANGETVHWVYVKQSWRKRGIMTRLIPQSVQNTTHLTELGSTIIKKLKPNLVFNPFIT